MIRGVTRSSHRLARRCRPVLHLWYSTNISPKASLQSELLDQRRILDDFANWLNLQSKEDWYNVRSRQIIKAHGPIASLLMNQYNGSVSKMVTSVYSDHCWQPWCWRSRSDASSNFMASPDSLRLYLDWLGHKLGLNRDLSSWYTVTPELMKSQPGGSVLLRRFNKSLPAALAAAYPEHSWDSSRFNGAVVPSIQNDRKILEQAASRLGILSMSNWYSVRSSALSLPTEKLVLRRHSGSLSHAVSSAFPEHEWELWKFAQVPRGFWASTQYQQQYLAWLGKHLNLTMPEDWFNLTGDDLKKHHGATLLRINNGSVVDSLRNSFPELAAQPWRFKKPASRMWNSPETRTAFLAYAAAKLRISSLEDWYQVSKTQLSELGGSALLILFGRSLARVLEDAYPQHNWEPARFNQRNKQRTVEQERDGQFVHDDTPQGFAT